MPDVTDDLNKVWEQQTTLHRPKNSMYSTFTTADGFNDTKSAYKSIQRRSNSNFGVNETPNTLKMAGKNLAFPKR